MARTTESIKGLNNRDDPATDQSDVGRVTQVAREEETVRHNLSIDGAAENGVVGSGFNATGSGKTAAATGKGADEKRKKERHHREMMDRLLMLQRQIDDLNAQIADLDQRITNIESRVFTPEERATFDALPEDKRFAAKDKAMREKVENGEISPTEYEQWKAWNEERAAKQDRVDGLKDQLASENAAVREHAQKNAGIDELREARKDLLEPKKIETEISMEARDDEGNMAKRTDFDSLVSGDDIFGGLSKNQSSFAAQAAPEAGIKSRIPTTQTLFNAAASQIAADDTLDPDRNPTNNAETNSAPLTSMG